MGLLRPLIRFADQESLHPDLGRALRATVAFMVPLLAARLGWLTHDATFVAIAAQNIAMVDVRGAYRFRIGLLVVMTAILTATVALGAVAGATLLTAVVAVSMAATPLATAAYDRLVLSRGETRAEPERLPFDESAPDVIVAGFGRFGQIATRLLTAHEFKVVLLDSSIEQIDVIRKFGWRVHYGDATRLDLLRAAGAERARLLIVGIDDKDKATELVETASKALPNLTIVARAFDRLHAYELLRAGADEVERETFEGALALGAASLRRLGLRSRQAHRAAASFRGHDRRMFEELAPAWAGDIDEAYILASREAQQTMEQLLIADLAQLRPDGQDSWNVDSLEAELRDRAKG